LTLGLGFGIIVDKLTSTMMPAIPASRIVAENLGWDLGDVIDTAAERTSEKWVYFSGLSHHDDRMICTCCGAATHAVSDFVTGGHDPYHAYVLACGHTVI
jgi:hypothetical protein